ncbi:MAG TPA: cupin domain-containing protein [Bacteroidota bacterium]|nr:cupin domain-containing protein [Bacteroidota bacterium]
MFRMLAVMSVVGILAFAATAQESSGISTTVLVKSDSSWDGTPLPSYPKGAPEITVLRIAIPPGEALPLHRHPVINAGILLSGELTVTTDKNETKILKEGDALVEVVGKWHYGRNTGKGPAVILVFYAGERGKPITERK